MGAYYVLLLILNGILLGWDISNLLQALNYKDYKAFGLALFGSILALSVIIMCVIGINS